MKMREITGTVNFKINGLEVIYGNQLRNLPKRLDFHPQISLGSKDQKSSYWKVNLHRIWTDLNEMIEVCQQENLDALAHKSEEHQYHTRIEDNNQQDISHQWEWKQRLFLGQQPNHPVVTWWTVQETSPRGQVHHVPLSGHNRPQHKKVWWGSQGWYR